jgi:N-acetylglutamate synthase-like GNAT family acetyltransferase
MTNNSIEFLTYCDAFKSDLRRLTFEWLEKYVSVEPEDIMFMNNPSAYVLYGGGFIFLAKCNNEIVGTVSLYKLSDNKYELAKLAVTEKYRGLEIGKRLVFVAINKCKEVGASQVILYTTKKLEIAYNLYLNLGFVEIIDEQKKYICADIKMSLYL